MYINRNFYEKVLIDGSVVIMIVEDLLFFIIVFFSEGVIYEFCVGIIDKNTSFVGLMR